MTVHLSFVSHISYPESRLYYGSLASGHKSLASISQQVTRKQSDQCSAQLKIVKLQRCVLHTPSQSVGKAFLPAYTSKGYQQPDKTATISSAQHSHIRKEAPNKKES